MSRNGKIARMPEFIRTVIGRSLENNLDTGAILDWINSQPEARKVLQLRFGNQPVSKQNLSEWRRGGFHEWQRQEAACDLVRGLMDKSEALDRTASEDGSVHLSDRLSMVMMAELIEVAQAMMKEAHTTGQRWERLRDVFPLLNRIRMMDIRAKRLHMAEMNHEVKLKVKAMRLRGDQAVAPVLNLMAEEAVHRAMAMGPNYNQRAKDICNAYFRPGEKPAVEKEEESSSRRHSPRTEPGKEAGAESPCQQDEPPSPVKDEDEPRSRRRKEAGSGSRSRHVEEPATNQDEKNRSRRRSPRPERGKEAAHGRRRRSQQPQEARAVTAPTQTDESATLGAAMSTSPVRSAPGDETASETATSTEMGAENLQPNTTSEAVPSEQVPTTASACSQTGSNPVKPSQSENETSTPNEVTAGKTDKPAAAPDPLAAILAAADLVQRGHEARRKQIHDSFNNPAPPKSAQE